MKFRYFAFLPFIALLFASCESVSSTERFYRSYAHRSLPPKPKNSQTPIFRAYPKGDHEVLGNLSFSTTKGYDFIVRSLHHNASRVGADATVVKQMTSKDQFFTYHVPGYTTYQPVTTRTTGSATANYYGSSGYTGYGSASGSSTSTTYVPQEHPGYSGVGTRTVVTVDADFIVYGNNLFQSSTPRGTTAVADRHKGLSYGTRVPGRADSLCYSPFSRAAYVDIRGMPRGTAVICPTTGRPFLVP